MTYFGAKGDGVKEPALEIGLIERIETRLRRSHPEYKGFWFLGKGKILVEYFGGGQSFFNIGDLFRAA